MADFFFATSTAPSNLAESKEKVDDFLHRHHQQQKQNPSSSSPPPPRIALVTGGGTRINLERNTVRFIDNFSSGGRAAYLVESLLREGYLVIFLHRTGCVAPFSQNFAAALDRDPSASSVTGGGGGGGHHRTQIDLDFLLNSIKIVQGENGEKLELVLKEGEPSHTAISSLKSLHSLQSNLLCLPFLTLSDYLFLLRMTSERLAPFSSRAIIILAAAVSDFFIPEESVSDHKIQSREGPIELKLEQTPKMLGLLRTNWAPQAMIVSFKLETEEKILLSKARAAIDHYKMDCVVANELHSRNSRLFLVLPGMEVREFQVSQRGGGAGGELEDKLVRELVEMHSKKIEGGE